MARVSHDREAKFWVKRPFVSMFPNIWASDVPKAKCLLVLISFGLPFHQGLRFDLCRGQWIMRPDCLGIWGYLYLWRQLPPICWSGIYLLAAGPTGMAVGCFLGAPYHEQPRKGTGLSGLSSPLCLVCIHISPVIVFLGFLVGCERT